nr:MULTISPECIES: site-specific integrase [unclassified Dysgonomonas]
MQSELKRRNPSMTVLAQNKALINQIEGFGRFKTFSDFTYINVIDFDAHLKDNGLAEPTAYKRHSLLHGYIREAINRGYCTYDPYITFRPKKGKSNDPVYLEEYELNAILNCKLEEKVDSDRLIKVRDTFVFQCFTGLAYIDIKNLRQEDIQLGFDNKVWIMTKREKTNINVNVPLLEIPRKILAKYKDELDSNKILPIMSNQKMNEYLKEIANLCGIDKSLSFHLARHTFATTVTLSKGVPIESVSKMLGHTNVQTTQIYARIINEKISYDMANLARRLKKKL